MKSALTVALFLTAGIALFHSIPRGHIPPQADTTGYFSIEALTVLLFGLSVGGLIIHLRRRKEMLK